MKQLRHFRFKLSLGHISFSSMRPSAGPGDIPQARNRYRVMQCERNIPIRAVSGQQFGLNRGGINREFYYCTFHACRYILNMSETMDDDEPGERRSSRVIHT